MCTKSGRGKEAMCGDIQTSTRKAVRFLEFSRRKIGAPILTDA
jgi:hypothetical protein